MKLGDETPNYLPANTLATGAGSWDTGDADIPGTTAY
jgi:hypothetical protein